MCTVTIVGLAGGGFRLADNRDERDGRPAARPPRLLAFGARRAILPIDPQGGGTWVAVNEAGLALAILNVNPGSGPASAGRISRGRIIPLLLHSAGVGEAAAEAAGIHPPSHAPFRLVFTDGREVAEAVSDGARLRLDRGPLPAIPVLFTSSSLGDGMVQEPRRALFEELFARGGDPIAIQDAFHAHAWPDRPEVSVLMRRPGARTVSRTVITVGDGGAMLTYAPIPEPGAAAPIGRSVVRRLPLRHPRPEVV